MTHTNFYPAPSLDKLSAHFPMLQNNNIKIENKLFYRPTCHLFFNSVHGNTGVILFGQNGSYKGRQKFVK